MPNAAQFCQNLRQTVGTYKRRVGAETMCMLHLQACTSDIFRPCVDSFFLPWMHARLKVSILHFAILRKCLKSCLWFAQKSVAKAFISCALLTGNTLQLAGNLIAFNCASFGLVFLRILHIVRWKFDSVFLFRRLFEVAFLEQFTSRRKMILTMLFNVFRHTSLLFTHGVRRHPSTTTSSL